MTATTVTRNKRRNSIVLEGWSTTNRNKKLIIKGIIDINYWESNYSYKKQVPITASFSASFFLTKNSGRSVLHAKKGKSVFFDDSKEQIWERDMLFKLFGYSMILIPFWQKKEKYISKKLRSDDLLSWSQRNFR